MKLLKRRLLLRSCQRRAGDRHADLAVLQHRDRHRADGHAERSGGCCTDGLDRGSDVVHILGKRNLDG